MKKLGLALASLALAAASFASCALATGTPNAATSLSSSDLKSLQSSYMLSYYADSSGSPEGVSSIRALTPFSAASASSGVAARTTVPVEQYTSLTFSSTPQYISNYPEPGETTSFTATEIDAANHVYDIKVSTTYPSTDARESYFEEYYVEDVDTIGVWTSADPVVTGIVGSWSSAPSARVAMTLSYRDGSSRSEAIYTSTAAGGSKYSYAALSLNGAMDLASISAAPATTSDSSVKFSSVAVYTYQPAKDSSSFWFWKGHKGAGIIGIRYYTEYADEANSKYIGRSVSYEKIVGSFGTFSVSVPSNIETAIYNSSLSNIFGASVVREEVQFALNGTKDGASGSALSSHTKMQTRISDYTNSCDYVLTQDNTDKVTLGSPLPW